MRWRRTQADLLGIESCLSTQVCGPVVGGGGGGINDCGEFLDQGRGEERGGGGSRGDGRREGGRGGERGEGKDCGEYFLLK